VPGKFSLALPAESASVPAARAALADFARQLGLDPAKIDDLKTVVTEACANVVEHAYGENPGSIEIEATAGDELMTVTVRDRGFGMGQRHKNKASSLKLGLVLIANLTHGFEVSSPAGGGTELTMRLAI
jgi:anti-sigma regulatory factor (Ser/Thr protein kinase)